MANNSHRGTRVPAKYGGEGVDIVVAGKNSNEKVFVSKEKRLFVCVEDSHGDYRLNGVPVRMAQINEMGKIIEFSVYADWSDEEMSALEWFGLAQQEK